MKEHFFGGAMEFRESKTFVNLQAAYDMELMSSTRFEIYGDKATTDGFIDISNMLNDISHQEKAHAVIWLRYLNNGDIPSTQQNLASAMEYQTEAGKEIYREYARVAREEGFNDIAALFNGVANIELNHDLDLQTKLNNINNNKEFCKDDERLWICLNCGNIMSGICAPEICPVCLFPQGYYAIFV